MLPPDYLDDLPDRVAEQYAALEERILQDMARRISKTGKMTDTAEWQYRRLEELEQERRFIQQELGKLTGKTQRQLAQLFQEAGIEALKYDDSIYRAAGLSPSLVQDNPYLAQLINAGLSKTEGTFRNLTSTTAEAALYQFEAALDTAYMDITSGAFTYQEAVRGAIKTLAREGLDAVRYSSGHTDKMDVAIRRAVLTGINQTCAKLSEARADEMGCDLVETTAHPGARPSHAVWQGKVFSRSGNSRTYPSFSLTGYGTGAGLCGWNCRHSFYPYFEGLSKTAYSHNKLSEYKTAKVTYNGKAMSLYDATQQQRYIERMIRRWKREYKAMDAAGLDTTEASARLAKWRRTEKDFVRQTGLQRDSFRSQAAGFGRSEAATAAWAAKPLQQFRRRNLAQSSKELIPNHRAAMVPKQKLVGYALNKNHPGDGRNKAIAFERALGYTVDNAGQLESAILKGLAEWKAKKRAATQYGQPFQVTMLLKGPNGKYAKVKTGWIIDHEGSGPRLTTLYVDE